MNSGSVFIPAACALKFLLLSVGSWLQCPDAIGYEVTLTNWCAQWCINTHGQYNGVASILPVVPLKYFGY